jgi:hypothetical protein
MFNLSKYRYYSVWIMVIMTLALVLAIASWWNVFLTVPGKKAAWTLVFLILVFISGILLFRIAYNSSDTQRLEEEKKNAFEAGKSEILKELESRNQQEIQQKAEQEDIDKSVKQIITGLTGGRGQKTANKILARLAKNLDFVQGILYIRKDKDDSYMAEGEYALTGIKPRPFRKGEGLAGQAAENGQPIVLYDIPEHYMPVVSGLGNAQPRFLILLPLLADKQCLAVLEMATFKKPDSLADKVLQRLTEELGTLIQTTLVS